MTHLEKFKALLQEMGCPFEEWDCEKHNGQQVIRIDTPEHGAGYNHFSGIFVFLKENGQFIASGGLE